MLFSLPRRCDWPTICEPTVRSGEQYRSIGTNYASSPSAWRVLEDNSRCCAHRARRSSPYFQCNGVEVPSILNVSYRQHRSPCSNIARLAGGSGMFLRDLRWPVGVSAATRRIASLTVLQTSGRTKIYTGRIETAFLTSRCVPFAAMRAGHSGHMAWTTRSQCSSLSRNLSGRAYSTLPSWAARPYSLNIGIASHPWPGSTDTKAT